MNQFNQSVLLAAASTWRFNETQFGHIKADDELIRTVERIIESEVAQMRREIIHNALDRGIDKLLGRVIKRGAKR